MPKLCFFCGKYMGEKYDNHQNHRVGIFHSVCNECSCRNRVDERLPELVRAIADLRKRNGSMEQPQPVGVLSAV